MRIVPVCELPEGATRAFTAPDQEGHKVAVAPDSFLDRNFDEGVEALLGNYKTHANFEIQHDLPRDCKTVLREGVETRKVSPVRLLSAVRALGLVAQVPARRHESELVNTLWTRRYIRGYLIALRAAE